MSPNRRPRTFPIVVAMMLIVGIACSTKANAQTIHYEKPTSVGSAPFTPPAVTTGSKSDFNTTPFGGSGDIKVCDPEKLISFLNSHHAEKVAWTTTLGVPIADFERYVRSLAPVILQTDVRVTNHGFRDGKAFALQSILAAGTAVLADRAGHIVVKCYCGNPLTPPTDTTDVTCVGCPPNYAPPPPCTDDCYDCPTDESCPSPAPEDPCASSEDACPAPSYEPDYPDETSPPSEDTGPPGDNNSTDTNRESPAP